MFTLFLNAIGGLCPLLIEVAGSKRESKRQKRLVIDPVRLWSVQQEHYWDQTDW